MKLLNVAIAAALLGCAAAGGSSLSVRKKVEDQVSSAMKEYQAALSDVKERRQAFETFRDELWQFTEMAWAEEWGLELGEGEGHRKLDVPNSYPTVDGTNGCDCAKDAMMAVYDAEEEVLDSVPLTLMGLLKQYSNDIVEGTNLDFDPENDFKFLIMQLKTIVWCTQEALKDIECGYCDLHDSKRDGTAPPRSGTTPFPPDPNPARTPYFGVNHFECCCDVQLIQELAINHIHTIGNIIRLNPGGQEFFKEGTRSMQKLIKCTIDLIADKYETTTTTTIHIA